MQGCPPAQWPLAMYGKSLIFFFFFIFGFKVRIAQHVDVCTTSGLCVWLPVKAREPRGSWAMVSHASSSRMQAVK